jgi:hypothetical protein
MKTKNHEGSTSQGWLAHSIDGKRTAVRRRHGLILLIAMAVLTTCTASYAQTVIGSPGAGFQNWTATDLNNNGAPFWDAPTTNSQGNPDSKNVGYCLTGGGDCVGINSPLFAPGRLPYWGMPFDSVNDANGALDPKVYFRRKGAQRLKATLELQLSTVPVEINEFGWFETNATGSVVGARHILFKGGGVPPGTLTPDPVGKTVTFRPTHYFGYYFSDVSENGCLAYTLFAFNTPNGCAKHNIVVFATKPNSPHSAFWLAGEDPAGCGDGDCNLTLVKVAPTD